MILSPVLTLQVQPPVQDTPFYHTLENPAQINGKMVSKLLNLLLYMRVLFHQVAEVGYDIPIELLHRQVSP